MSLRFWKICALLGCDRFEVFVAVGLRLVLATLNVSVVLLGLDSLMKIILLSYKTVLLVK